MRQRVRLEVSRVRGAQVMIPDTPVQEDVRPRAGIRALTVARQRWNHTSFLRDVISPETWACKNATPTATSRYRGYNTWAKLICTMVCMVIGSESQGLQLQSASKARRVLDLSTAGEGRIQDPEASASGSCPRGLAAGLPKRSCGHGPPGRDDRERVSEAKRGRRRCEAL